MCADVFLQGMGDGNADVELESWRDWTSLPVVARDSGEDDDSSDGEVRCTRSRSCMP